MLKQQAGPLDIQAAVSTIMELAEGLKELHEEGVIHGHIDTRAILFKGPDPKLAGFFPKAIFVSRDVPVRLFVTGATKGSLCLMMDSFNVRKQIRANKIEEITFTPNQPGTYRFYCPVNGSEGTLVVKELTTANDGSGT